MNTYNFLEVCAGAGGLSTGLIKSGFMPLLLIDNDKNCCKTLKKNHEKINIKNECFTKIDYTEFINKIDLLCGGIPCQSFSYAGKRKGLDDNRGKLIFNFIELINKIKPKIFLIENVKGLKTHDNGKTLEEIIKKIDNSIYNIKYEILNSYNFGVPQKRERLIIIGTLKNINFEFPKKYNNFINLKDVLINVPKSDGVKYNELKKELFKKIPQGGCWKNLTEIEQKEYLGKSFYSGGGKTGILHRLDMNKPSLTLLCSPTQKQTERCHPLEERPLNIREYARIQTFDDTYIFHGSKYSQYKQIGNSVPVNLAYEIGKNLIKSLDNYLK